jgi:hypothetical protein
MLGIEAMLRIQTMLGIEPMLGWQAETFPPARPSNPSWRTPEPFQFLLRPAFAGIRMMCLTSASFSKADFSSATADRGATSRRERSGYQDRLGTT